MIPTCKPTFASKRTASLTIEHVLLLTAYSILLEGTVRGIARCVQMHIKWEQSSSRVKGLAFHPRRPWVITSLHSGDIQVYDYELRVPVETYKGHSGSPRDFLRHRAHLIAQDLSVVSRLIRHSPCSLRAAMT